MNRLPFVERGKAGDMDFSQSSQNQIKIIFVLYLIAVFSIFFLLIVRLFQLTVVKGSYYRRLSENNRIREIIIEPQRGTIIDRNGTVLAENIAADVHQNSSRILSTRRYTDGETNAHVIGYIQNADQKDFKDDSCLNKLQLGDKTGKKGIEKLFDCQLRGNSGKKLVETDARGKLVRTLSIVEPVNGQTIKLALDETLQKKALELLKNRKGSVIALKPQTGEILALASYPTFDPQVFEDSNIQRITDYFKNTDKPLFNRATEGVYPPGSIFKLVVAGGALEEKKISGSTTVEDTGVIKAGQASFGNWYYLQYGKTEGSVNIVKAIRRSNDIFFYKTGEVLGAEHIKTWAETFGYGKQTGLGLNEASGTVPSPFWKEEMLKEQWYLGDTYNYSIGQGYTLVTPLQTALATAVFANGGYLCKPQVLKRSNGDTQLNVTLPAYCHKLPLSSQTISTIREGMKEECSTGGTGWPFFDFKPQVGCKTGTAESNNDASPHAWFSVFAPFDKPEIAVTVVVEQAGQGSDIAAPVAKELLKSYFK